MDPCGKLLAVDRDREQLPIAGQIGYLRGMRGERQGPLGSSGQF